MLRFILAIGAVCLIAVPGRSLLAEDDAWQAEQLKKLTGRWTSSREEKDYKGEIRRTRVEVEFVDGWLNLTMFYEKSSPQSFTRMLKVAGVEKVGEGVLGTISRLQVERSASQSTGVYCDFVGEKLILVGALPWRPFEGFSLSGEYTRVAQPE